MPRPYRTPGVGPHSKAMRRHQVAVGTPYDDFLVAARKELADQLGEPLTASQRILVDRIAWLKLHCALFDEKATKGGGVMGEHDRKSYLAFSNSLTRALRALNGTRPVGRPKTVYQPGALENILAEVQFNEAAE